LKSIGFASYNILTHLILSGEFFFVVILQKNFPVLSNELQKNEVKKIN
jgi:hypothetical protein